MPASSPPSTSSRSSARGRASRLDIGALLNVDRVVENLDHVIANEQGHGLVAVLVVRPDVTGTLQRTSEADFITWAGDFQHRLTQVDERIRLAFRSAEEAIGFVPGLVSRREIEPLVDRLAQALDAPMSLGAVDIEVDSRVGLAIVDANNAGRSEAIEAANLALTRTRPDRRARSFRPFHRLQRDQQVQLEDRIRHDLEHGQVMVRYQPILDLASGAVHGIEALARLRDGRRGELSPGVFIPIALRHGLMAAVGSGVLARVGEDVSRWRTQVSTALTVWINLSVRELFDPGTMASIDRLTDHQALVRVGVELTETTRSSADELGRACQLLAERDLPVAVDYHSMALTEVARSGFDTVKLSRRVIRHLDARSSDATPSLVAMLHALDVSVTAEGIETEGHLRPAVAAGCDHGQGFYFARPTHAEAIDRLLAAGEPTVLHPADPAQRST